MNTIESLNIIARLQINVKELFINVFILKVILETAKMVSNYLTKHKTNCM